MSKEPISANLAQKFLSVKPSYPKIISTSSDSVIHHNLSPGNRKKMIVSYDSYQERRYGVSSARRILSPQALLKWIDVVREGLRTAIGLSDRQAEVAIRLLRLWCYYERVYPKASQIAGEPDVSPSMISWRYENGLGDPPQSQGVSRATFWRTIKILESLGLVKIVSRYVIREHAQISNLYRLDKLVMALVRYIAEHREFACPPWLRPFLGISGRQFWSFLDCRPGESPIFDWPALDEI